jgi:hypothetical protein
MRIGEKWSSNGANPAWPEWEVTPTSPWNYGLVLDDTAASSIQVVRRTGPMLANPFTPDTAPLRLRAKAKKIPGWTLDRYGLAGALQDSPIRSKEPAETVTLIPMGAARLRLSSFPVIGNGPDAQEWTPARPQ